MMLFLLGLLVCFGVVVAISADADGAVRACFSSFMLSSLVPLSLDVRTTHHCFVDGGVLRPLFFFLYYFLF